MIWRSFSSSTGQSLKWRMERLLLMARSNPAASRRSVSSGTRSTSLMSYSVRETASWGQTATQCPHWMQPSPKAEIPLSVFVSRRCGHSRTHMPHWIHLSGSIRTIERTLPNQISTGRTRCTRRRYQVLKYPARWARDSALRMLTRFGPLRVSTRVIVSPLR